VCKRHLSIVACALALGACSGADGVTPLIAADAGAVATGTETDGGVEAGPGDGWATGNAGDDAPQTSAPDATLSDDDTLAAPSEQDSDGPPPATLPGEVPWLDDPVWQCENGVPISVVVDILLPANSAGCPWGEGANLSPAQGAFAAYQLTTVSAELPGPAQAICGVNMNSASFDPDYEQPFVYDDHFMLVFNDVVLLSSYGDLMDVLPTERNWYLFDWNAIAGASMNFNNSSAFCLGYGDEDDVSCSIPAPDSNGPVAYSIDGGLGNALSSRAVQQQRVEFALATFGDNDPDSDCRNSELRMKLVIDYVIAP
jgi:hypothetical protein